MTTSQIMVKKCAQQKKKQAYLYLEPQDNRQQIYVCIIPELHCTLLSPLLHFVLVAVWTAGGKKTLFVQWQKPTRKGAEVFKSKCRNPSQTAHAFYY